jgi:2-amino-4-hydroxy-6-hydroxymethyldihydropteridine diphosphokinase
MTISVANLTAFRSTAFIALGSNLDHPSFQVQRALREIDDIGEVALVKISSMYETVPVGMTDQPAFVNAVAQVETLLSPQDLLGQLLDIEKRHGRVRAEKNGPRTLDLDILIFNEWRLDEPDLTTPHPRMHERAFVLVPLLEIAPEIYIPGKGYGKEHLAKLDAAGVKRMTDDDDGKKGAG